MPEDYTINKYDRLYAGLQDVSLFTKPSTCKLVQTLTGRSETFIVQTARHSDLGDYIFVECTDETGTVRIALPPKVSAAIGFPAGQPHCPQAEHHSQAVGSRAQRPGRGSWVHAEEESLDTNRSLPRCQKGRLRCFH